MTLRDFALVLCLAGGLVGIGAGIARKEWMTGLLGLVVVAIAVAGLI